MKQLLTLAVLFLAFAAQADQNWVRVIVEPNWNLGDNSPGPGSADKYTVYYAPTNGWGNTAEEILPKLKLFSPKEFEENFTKLEAPAATYSRNDLQYTFTEYGATIDPTKAYFTVILCDGGTNYGHYYRVIDSHLSNYDQFLSGEPNEKCSAHLSFGYFYKIDIAYAFTTVTDEAGEETYISYMTDWDQGKLESAGEFLAGESRTYSTVEMATAAAAKINANPRKQISIPEELKNADDATLNSYCDMFVMTLSDKTVSVNLTSAAQANIQSTVDAAATNILYGVTNGLSTVTLSTVPGISYTISYGADTNSVVTMANLVATANTMEVVVSTNLNPLVENIWITAAPTGEIVSFAGTASIELVKFQAPGRRQFATVDLAARVAALVNGDMQKYVEPIANLSEAFAEGADDYLSYYAATANKCSVSIGLTSTAKTAIQSSVAAARSVVFDAIVNRTNEVAITGAVPGIYYSIEYGRGEALGEKTDSVLATSANVTLACPANIVLSQFAFRVKATAPISAGGVQLWKGGPYWAECNVGANTEDEVGYYFWWGDTGGYVRNESNTGWVSVQDGAAFKFESANCPTYKKTDAQLQENGYIDSTGNLTPAHDAATVHLGASWRMPRYEDCVALTNYCERTLITNSNNVVGWILTGKGDYSSKNIFLPVTDIGASSGWRMWKMGSYSWSATSAGGTGFYSWLLQMNFSKNTYYFNLLSNVYRGYGMPVRAVKYPETFVSEMKVFNAIEDGGECASEAQAIEVAASITNDLRHTIAIPSALKSANATEESLSTYCNLYGATVSGTTVFVDLTPAATNVIQESVNDAQEEVLSAVLDGAGKATIDAVPGIYYAIEYGTGLDLGSNTPGTMATGFTVDLDKPRLESPAAFLRVKADREPIEAQEQ